MLHTELKDWIVSNLMTFSVKKNKQIIIPKRVTKTYFENNNWSEIFNDIFNITSFLPVDRSFRERLYCIMSGIDSAPICSLETCSNIVQLGFNNDGYEYCLHCSSKCAQNNKETRNKSKLTNLVRRGTEYPLLSEDCKNKAKQTNLNNYGVENASQSSIIKDKKRNKSIEKYGTEVVLQNETIKEQIKQTNLAKYGYDNPQKSPEIRRKTTKTRKSETLNKYINSEKFKNVELLFNIDDFIAYKCLKFSCRLCNTEFAGKIREAAPPKCRVCFPKMTSKSHYEVDIKNYIETFYDGVVELNAYILDGKEIDVYLPELKIGFEFNGLYWHSEISGNKEPNYHLNKSNIATKYGIKLFHIYEDYWNDFQEIVKSQIKSLVGFSDIIPDTVNYKIKRVSTQQSYKFLENNSYNFIEPVESIGIYHKNKLVQLLVINDNNEIEFHCKKFTEFKNGNTILFDYLLKQSGKAKFVIYQKIDFENITSDVYSKLNFTLTDVLPPTFDYVNKFCRLDEYEIHNFSNIDKLWNCGKIRYIFNKSINPFQTPND